MKFADCYEGRYASMCEHRTHSGTADGTFSITVGFSYFVKLFRC